MAQPQSYTVLVIDDDPYLNEMMVTSLQFLGKFQVLTALDGMQGLERCIDNMPDVAIIDVKMPELNGYQVVRALRGDPSTANMPIIMLTALVQERDELRGSFSGADIYLRKPVDPYALIKAINDVLTLDPHQRLTTMQHLAELPLKSNTEAAQ